MLYAFCAFCYSLLLLISSYYTYKCTHKCKQDRYTAQHNKQCIGFVFVNMFLRVFEAVMEPFLRVIVQNSHLPLNYFKKLLTFSISYDKIFMLNEALFFVRIFSLTIPI